MKTSEDYSGSDEDEHDAYLEQMKAEGAERDDDDSDSEGTAQRLNNLETINFFFYNLFRLYSFCNETYLMSRVLRYCCNGFQPYLYFAIILRFQTVILKPKLVQTYIYATTTYLSYKCFKYLF